LIPSPLYRLTPLRDDPAAGWLSPLARAAVVVTGWLAWGAFGLFIIGEWLCLGYLLDTLLFVHVPRLPGLLAGATLAASIVPLRRAITALKSRATGKRARAAATAEAVAVDDLRALADEPDGRVVSVVGWVRGHSYLQHLVEGQRAVGLTLVFRDTHAYLLETMQNFDLVGEADDEALVVTSGGRLIGKTNVHLSRGSYDTKLLLSSLELPMSATPTDWNAFVIRDGDPVMLLGTKTTVQDFAQQSRGAPATTWRAAVASAPARPLLVFPLAAERRDV
jgi:hypothetical protein